MLYVIGRIEHRPFPRPDSLQQSGSDRIFTEKITKESDGLKAVATKIFSLKHQKLKTTDDYIHDAALPEFDAKVQSLADAFDQGEKRDRARGAINIQRFCKTSGTEYTKNVKDMIEEFQESLSLTREGVAMIRKMAELPNQEQVAYWEQEFKPLLTREDALGERLRASVTKEATFEK